MRSGHKLVAGDPLKVLQLEHRGIKKWGLGNPNAPERRIDFFRRK